MKTPLCVEMGFAVFVVDDRVEKVEGGSQAGGPVHDFQIQRNEQHGLILAFEGCGSVIHLLADPEQARQIALAILAETNPERN